MLMPLLPSRVLRLTDLQSAYYPYQVSNIEDLTVYLSNVIRQVFSSSFLLGCLYPIRR